MKKVVSLLLVMLMVLGMSVTVFAIDFQVDWLGKNQLWSSANRGTDGVAAADFSVIDWDARPGDKLYLPLDRTMFEGGVTGAVTSSYLSSNRTTARIAIASGRKFIASVKIDYIAHGSNITINVINAGVWQPGPIPVAVNQWVTANPVPWTDARALTNRSGAFASLFNANISSNAAVQADLIGRDIYGYAYTCTANWTLNAANQDTLSLTFKPNKTATVVIEMIRPYIETEKTDTALTAYLLIDGKRQEAWECDIEGTLDNFHRDTWADTYYFDGTQDEVADAQEYAKDVEWDLGNELSLFTKLFKGKKYYGISTREPDERDDVVFAKYPDIDGVYNVLVVGLNSTTDYAMFKGLGGEYHVYDKDLKYLGTSADKLDFSSKYYLANKKLDIQGDDTYEEPDDEGDEPEDSPPTGGNEYPSNVNDNPGTGR